MPPISFFAPGDPKGQPRPRAFARRMGNKFVARVYEAGTAENWKSQIALAATPCRPAAPLAGPVFVSSTFIFARPKKHFKSNNPDKGLRDDAPLWHTSKPDRDNLEKALLDTLTQVGGFWRDDSQVCSGPVRKLYGATPGCTVVIRELTQEEAAA